MSTFDGYVKEFPTIRIDYFRSDSSLPHPAACFLSHVHSDHLLGLESLKMPFIFCSATTRRLLLRMEKYPHRINFQKGILESRKQHWKHLKKLLRALPLHTPTMIELSPKLTINVTLIDANHCPGAVMFLIEGDGKAILYTGDVRAEPWWVNSLVQVPSLLPYNCGLKRLDCIYLDTTFAPHDDKYRHFQTKAEGLRELITKVQQCQAERLAQSGKPPTYYFRAWTLGYEQVWLTLANTLGTTIHVDPYQLRLFDSKSDEVANAPGYHTFEGPSLTGFEVGNKIQEGCLSTDTTSLDIVWVTPIICRLSDGTELLEVGAGGGGGDLYQTSELELTQDLDLISAELISDPDTLARFRKAIQAARDAGDLTLPLEGLGLDNDSEVNLKDFIQLLSKGGDWASKRGPGPGERKYKWKGSTITFPFSRHSSLGELRHLVQAFRPKDLYACTVELPSWTEECSMQALFGDLCSEQIFHHDVEVREEERDDHIADDETESVVSDMDARVWAIRAEFELKSGGSEFILIDDDDGSIADGGEAGESQVSLTTSAFASQRNEDTRPRERAPDHAERAASTRPAPRADLHRKDAYERARQSLRSSHSGPWDDLGIRSMGSKGHSEPEIEL
ncbi:Protein artemis [Cyphellophora attinorum]|uniref:Protein artemis n=1 Tax=Cyphellophora attinorum TaxID=1664694 RepID=A0A0N1HFU5_9EURO|nr:Protein artemis [Phialophora attinorum]KPI44217.1 Protein artemis [Phialophora attinorum]